MAEKKDWNLIFAARKAEHDRQRGERLSKARAAALGTGKEPFSAHRFRQLYAQLNPDDVDEHTPWETVVQEAEYSYYVTNPDVTTLKELVAHNKWLQGWG
ncbi:MAG: hypothetical protein ABIJ09_23610 [Pseudomonadota bacterium]